MSNRFVWAIIISGTVLTSSTARADLFDQFTNRDLAKAIATKDVRVVTELNAETLTEHIGVVRGSSATMLIVRTTQNRLAKLLVQPARQRIGNVVVPILLVDRYVTFREGTERAIQATGQNVQLYAGSHFNLDLGQVVPARVGGDLDVAEADTSNREVTTRATPKAKFYLVVKSPPATAPPKSSRHVVGEAFEIEYFNGVYKLFDDGRRSGTLHVRVDDAGEVSGSFFSDKDGQKYDVKGKVGNPRHAIQFTIKLPHQQHFQGHLFTGDARALAGTTRLQEREAAFYAVRVEE